METLDAKGAPELGDTAGYRTFEAGTLTVFRGILAVPPGIKATETIVPLVHPLEPGQHLRGHWIQPLPVRPHHPFQKLVLEQNVPPGHTLVVDREVSVDTVRIELGIVFVSKTAALKETPYAGAFRLWPPPSVATQARLVAERTCPAFAGFDFRIAPPEGD